MGLAGRKQKQRIPADPRNLSWADDASRFGLSYLSKFGWDASKGLGSSGDGMRTHLKVQQKFDMMGIGAQHQRDPNGIAWKQNKDFESLLKRLNEGAERGKEAEDDDAEGEVSVRETEMDNAFVRAQEEKVEGKLEDESSVKVKKRKRKEGEDSENTRKKQKKDKKEKKEKRQKSSPDGSAAPAVDPTSEPPSELSSSKPQSEPISKSLPLAHRARIRAAKRIADKSASAIAEVLGIAPSSSASTSTSTPAPTPPSSSTPTTQSSFSLDNLTTSTKSVADYFKEKLLGRSSSSSPASSSTPSGPATPGIGASGLGLGFSPPDEDALPRRGIGSRSPAFPPPCEVLKEGSPSATGDGNVDSRDALTEKQRRKADRKAEKEKRKRQKAEANQAAPEGVPTAVKEQMEDDDAESTRRKSNLEKMEKKHPDQQEQPLVDHEDGTTEKRHDQNTASGPFPEDRKKSKKERKKQRS